MTVMHAPQQMFQYFGEPPYVRRWKHNPAEIKTLQKIDYARQCNRSWTVMFSVGLGLLTWQGHLGRYE
jgi:hypothetical protein